MSLMICHFSDWHGMWLGRDWRRYTYLPWADLYVCTGNMLPNSLGHREDWQYEKKFQRKFMLANPITPLLKNPDAPVVCVRGNHDHVDLYPLFPERRVFEVVEPEDTFTWTKDGRTWTIGGMRGVRFIRGNGPDERDLEALDSQVERIPKNLDLLVTHVGAYGFLDRMDGSKPDEDPNTGSPALRRYVEDNTPKAHLFGHIHERRSMMVRSLMVRSHTLFSNAATTVNLLKLR